jgi:hypothetical protein
MNIWRNARRQLQAAAYVTIACTAAILTSIAMSSSAQALALGKITPLAECNGSVGCSYLYYFCDGDYSNCACQNNDGDGYACE